ncbi:MAG: 2-succinyl-5-enolpyruvyl-6-hydroxy-3-cyclohexene-1-carboxylic-acid synthase [Opitutae bacterium]|nr:2-succinyl-5-enolpyruvyl-6-hydroxy-3-cyclohexene-1-carboxylic-acid synthase [Opitutae bacterium]
MNADSQSTARANCTWGCAVAKTLLELDVGQVVFSPGSRSTPLVLGCENQDGLQTIPILDERTAAFFALGLSKRTRTPTALICTSGSAPTHWFPSMVEADHSGVPLLLLSADRPPELQDCGAGQTINQVELFGQFTRAFHQIPLPDQSEKSLQKLRKLIVHAYSQSIGKNPGPVHLNFPFREPLISEDKEPFVTDLPAITPALHSRPDESLSRTSEILGELGSCKCLLVIAGEHAPLETFSKWNHPQSPPILCDSLSPLRETPYPTRILRFENLLRNDGFRQKAQPDAILQLGPLPTSKTLRKWIGKQNVPRIIIEPRGKNVDPLTNPSRSFDLNYELIPSLGLPECEKEWSDLWVQSEKQIEEKLDFFFSDETDWFEGKLARMLSTHLPKGSQLYVANSMPIRDLEWFWKGSDLGRSLFGNRGVNGIDGTLGTALGLAHDSQKPSFLLTGELAFLHDSNALLASRQFFGNLTVFLVNNQGGGIFENLPVAELPAFEKCFATPQDCNFKMLCEAHGVEHYQPDDWNALIELIESSPPSGIRVIEIRTDRKKDRDTRLELLGFGPDS